MSGFQHILRQFHPLRSLRAQISLTMATVVLSLSTIVSYIAADISKQQIETSQGEMFARQAASTVDVLDRSMFERYREIQIAATLDDIRSPGVAVDHKRELLSKLQTTFNAYAWIGICDEKGIGTVGTGKYLEGKDLSKRPWCTQGREKPFIGDVHDALLLSKLLPNPTGEMFYLLDVAAPVFDHSGVLQGVLCGHIFWRWAEEMLNSKRTPDTDLILLSKDGMTLAGPVKARTAFSEIAPQTMRAIASGKTSGYLIERWRDGKTYLVGFAKGSGYRDYPGLGWVTLFRQDVTEAFEPARQIQQRILLAGALLGIFFAVLGWVLAGRIARPILAITASAKKVSRGELTYTPPVVRGDGEVAQLSDAIHGMVTNLTQEIAERKRAEEGLRLAGKVFENNTEAIVITDAGNRIILVNEAFTTITGYKPDEVMGQNPRMFSSGKQTSEFYKAFWEQLLAEGYWEGELWNKDKQGRIFPEWVIVILVRDEAGAVTHHIAIYSDITERKQKEERIQYLANYDVLTGLPNRNLLSDRLSQALSFSKRIGKKVAVLFIDLDHFKNINDTLGHVVGDALLEAVARRLQQCVRATDTIARQGGDEFVAIMPDLVHESEAALVAEKIIVSMAEPFQIGGHRLTITPSIGVSIFPEDSEKPTVLMRNADMAMYRAKESGRNTFQFFTPEMNRHAQERLHLEMYLRQAISRDELMLHYQPQVDAATGRVISFEALLRWNSAELGAVSPARFIPVAEETGLILEIGTWVLREACSQARRWREAGYASLPVGVNVSARQFRQADWAETVQACIQESGIEPGYLELELTETMLMESGEHLIATMRRLRESGVRLALDDFGVGYSSLTRLKQFPLDRLKIDQAFVRDIGKGADSDALVTAIAAMGHAMNLKVMAEGVETEAQLAFLRGLRCEEMQGYYFGRPVPPQECEKFLRKAV
ncbi:MAG: EAL domain-containing protein [Pseudomonadota bacterium]